MSTPVERGSADCEPSGNAHRVTKATTRPDPETHRRWSRTVPVPSLVRGHTAVRSPWLPDPGRRCWDWRTGRRAQPSVAPGWDYCWMVATPSSACNAGRGAARSPEELSFPSDARARGLSIGMPDGDMAHRSAGRHPLGAGGVRSSPGLPNRLMRLSASCQVYRRVTRWHRSAPWNAPRRPVSQFPRCRTESPQLVSSAERRWPTDRMQLREVGKLAAYPWKMRWLQRPGRSGPFVGRAAACAGPAPPWVRTGARRRADTTGGWFFVFPLPRTGGAGACVPPHPGVCASGPSGTVAVRGNLTV